MGSDKVMGLLLERQIIDCYEDAITRYRRDGINAPVYIGISLIGIKQKQFFSAPLISHFDENFVIRDNVFNSPEIMIDLAHQEERPFGKALLPLVDIMWQVAGRGGTPVQARRRMESIWPVLTAVRES
jgi:hypothetical protein